MFWAAFINGLFGGSVRCTQASLVIRRLSGAVIGPSMCKTVHKHLHHVVDLCCGLGRIKLFFWFMASPGCSGAMQPNLDLLLG